LKTSITSVKQIDKQRRFGVIQFFRDCLKSVEVLKCTKQWVGIFLVYQGFCFIQPDLAQAATQSDVESVQKIKITKNDLLQAISENLPRVDEFRFIKEQADQLGVKVYLFGGTAAAYGHYAKWDLLRRKGDPRYHPARFDFKYINIYRSTQDLDIVVDGSIDKIDTLARAITESFPYMQGSKGSKQSWEVRSLREDMGDKLALLNSPDFLNQHTDSQSVGLIEITDPKRPSERIRDLRDWENLENSGFLNDLLEGKIHYYFSDKHETTKFFKDGRNPPILSVIRYFIKVFQLDLEMREEDRALLNKLISEFDPSLLDSHTYLPHWFADNGPKLIQNAIDVENAMKILIETGLRDKLLKIDSKGNIGSVAWWMNKQPLVSKPLGLGNDKTAKELKIDIIAHETTSFLVYEAMTRSHKLLPNVLISRRDVVGEAAALGDGFYAMIGDRSGFRGTGFTIRFRVKPEARLKTDFDISGQYILIHNRRAIEIIPETMNMGLLDYYDWLLSSPELSKDDLGIYQRLRLAMRASFANPSQDEIKHLREFTDTEVIKLLTVDPSPESKWLLLEQFSQRNPQPSVIMEVYRHLKDWAKSLSTEAQQVFFAKVDSEFSPQFSKVILAQNPDLKQLMEALGLGLFAGHDDDYLKQVLPQLYTLHDVQEFWKHWRLNWNFQRIMTQKRFPKHLRPLILELAKKFMAMNPTIEEIESLEYLRPEVKLAVFCLELKDPVMFLQLLKQGKDRQSGSKSLKVWKVKKREFFALEPSLSELREGIRRDLPMEIEIDLFDYVLTHFSFRRSTELRQFLDDLHIKSVSAQPTAIEKLYLERLESIMTKYLSLNPPMKEVSEVAGKILFNVHLQRIFIQHTIHKASRLNELFVLTPINQMHVKVNEVLMENPEQLQRLNFSRDDVREFAKKISYLESAYKVFKSYINGHPDDFELILDLMNTDLMKYASADQEFIEPLWLRAIEWKMGQSPSFGDLKILKGTMPSLAAYRKMLPQFLSRCKSIRELSSMLEQSLKIVDYSVVRPAQIHAVNDKWVPNTVQNLLNESTKTEEDLGLDDYSSLVKELSSPKAMMQIYNHFMVKGIQYNRMYSHLQIYGHNLTDNKVSDYYALLAIYDMLHREKVIDPKNNWLPQLNVSIVSNLKNTGVQKLLGIENEQELILAVHRYYLLIQIQRKVEQTNFNTGVRNIENEMSEIFNLSQFISTSPGASAIEKAIAVQIESIQKKYKSYPLAAWKESGSAIGAAFALVTLTKSKSSYDKELEKEIADADRIIDSGLRRLPHLKAKLDEALRPLGSGLRPSNGSCKDAIGK
jgi:hypothetical protein